MDPREIVVMARKLGVSSVDLVNVLWYGHANDRPWLNEFKRMAKDEGVSFTCLMCDETGNLGSSAADKRAKAIELHKPWVDAAAELGCSQLRVNAYGDGSYLAQMEQNAESLNKLADLGGQYDLDILIENHGHPSSNAAWLAMVVEKTDRRRVGVYTDLDNFFMGGWSHNPQRRYDRIQGLLDLAPYTRGVSAKSYDFDEQGQETSINYLRCMKLLVDAGFRGSVCAEYEGEHLSEYDGSRLTVELVRNVREKLC
jgi:sugar phosphate isomerase/epimerase